MAKTRRIEIRVDDDVANYIDSAASYHDCTRTDFIIKQCLRKEFVVIDFKSINELLRLFANVSNNINQIARTLNIMNKNKEVMTEEQFQKITYLFEEVKQEFNENHLSPMNKTVKEIYRLSRTQKERELDFLLDEEQEEVE